MNLLAGIFSIFAAASIPPHQVTPPHTFLVTQSEVGDEKAVFATVESANVVPARARIGGTVLELKVRQGDHVEEGQAIANVGDQKLALQVNSYSAQVQAAQAQVTQAKLEYDRAQRLIAPGAISRNMYDQAHTAYSVAIGNLKSVSAQRAVIEQQEKEGQILAPVSGRVITVPVTSGTVVMQGDAVATVAKQDFVLRLEVPERHAHSIRVGDPVRLDGGDFGSDGPRFGKIMLVYPQIDNGHVVADATVSGLSDYFVGERVQVWISAGGRKTVVVPANLITTRFGIDYARIWTAKDGAADIPVQRGPERPRARMPDGIEILSGLAPGDRLLQP